MNEEQLSRFWSHVEKSQGGCWRWTASTRDGYGRFWVKRLEHAVYAHRASYELVHGTIPAGMHCLHRCDTRSCVNPEHLFLGTNAENTADKVAKGRQWRGEKIWTAKLTAEDVREIRSRHAIGDTPTTLAKAFGIGVQHVGRIVRREKWKHVS